MAGIPINLGSTNWGLMLSTVFFIFLAIAVLAFFVWYVWRELQYKIPVTIHEANNKGYIRRQFTDKAKKIRRGEKNFLRLKKLKEEINNPPGDFYVNNGKNGLLYLRWDGGHILEPQKVAYNSPLTFEPAQYNILVKMAQRISTSAKRHGNVSFWQEYGHIIGWMIFIVLTSITMWILFTKLEVVAGAINNYASAVKSLNPGQVIS